MDENQEEEKLRIAILVPTEAFSDEFNLSTGWEVRIYIDEENSEQILSFLANNEKKFRRIIFEMLKGSYKKSLYDRENVSKRAKNMTAMKFMSGKNDNERIYCKEYIIEGENKEKKIVMIYLIQKDEFNKQIKELINRLSNYEYEFRDE